MLIDQKLLLGSDVAKNAVTNSSQPYLQFNGTQGGFRKVFSMSQDQLSAHLLLAGSTFSGKTNAFRGIISQIKRQMTQDDIMLVYDPKIDFRNLHEPGNYVLSNRTSEESNSVIWNVFGDITADGWDEEKIIENSKEIARVGFENNIKNNPQQFFPKAAMNIFSAVSAAMALIGKDDIGYRKKYLNNYQLRNFLRKLDAKSLNDFIGKFPQLSGVIKYVGSSGRSEQSLGVFAELESGVDEMLTGNMAKPGCFSIRRVARQRGGKTIFIEYDPSCGSYSTALSVVVDLFLKEALSPQHKRGKIYVILDELKMLSSSLNYFEHALNFARSLGLTVIGGIQSIEQLYELYGEYGGKNIASGFQSSFVFRTSNAATREYIKGINGKNLSCIQYLDSANKPQETTREGNVVEDWNISSLKQGEAIITLPSEKPFIFKFPKYN